MPASYFIDPQRRLVISRAWGDLTTSEVIEHYRSIASDPEFDSRYSQLADLTAVDHVDMTAGSVRREALETVFSSGAPRAFVVANDSQESAARLYSLFGKYVGQNVRVFNAIDQAERWLGLAAPADGPSKGGGQRPAEPPKNEGQRPAEPRP